MAFLQRSRPLLGTFVEIYLRADCEKSELAGASQLAFLRVKEIESLMSFHNPNSELSRINRWAHIESVPISPDTFKVLDAALELSEASGGLYDVTVASRLARKGLLPKTGNGKAASNWRSIDLTTSAVRFTEDVIVDLGGIAKGFAVDEVFETLRMLPIQFDQIIVNAGGDLRMLDWESGPVSVRYATMFGGKRFKNMTMRDASLASSTSKAGTPSSVIVDPRSGKFRSSLYTYGVFANSCMLADSLTKLVGVDPRSANTISRYGAKAFRVNIFGKMDWIRS